MDDNKQAADAAATPTLPAEPGATLPVPQGAADSGVTADQVEKSEGSLTKLRQNVIDKQKAVDDANKSKEQLALEDAQAKLGDAQSKHHDLAGAQGAAAAVPMTVAEAKVLAVVSPDTSAGDWRAQKFGNDPANPQMAPGVDPTANLTRLSRKTPDLPGDGIAYTEVPKEMVGDYERAGWNRT